MTSTAKYRCPNCDSDRPVSVQSTAIDSELLECEDCKRAYEVKYEQDGTVRLVSGLTFREFEQVCVAVPL
jgi:hypothetical protein